MTAQMQFGDIITPRRIATHMRVSSRKRMLEEISGLLRIDDRNVDANVAFHSLVERERLGTTAIGNGVALPHGRVKGLMATVGAFATLAEGIDCDAHDRRPVKIVFALLVPANAGKEHLQLLSQLASVLSDGALRDRLLSADSPKDIYHILVNSYDVTVRKVG